MLVTGFSAAVDQVEDGAKLALQAVVAPALAGGDDDTVDDFAQRIGGFEGVVGMVERGGRALVFILMTHITISMEVVIFRQLTDFHALFMWEEQ